MEAHGLVSLIQLATGTQGVVRQMQGGKEFASRLASMGLSIGTEFKVLQNWGHGPVLILARDTRIAIGHGQALKILVEEIKHEPVESE